MFCVFPEKKNQKKKLKQALPQKRGVPCDQEPVPIQIITIKMSCLPSAHEFSDWDVCDHCWREPVKVTCCTHCDKEYEIDTIKLHYNQGKFDPFCSEECKLAEDFDKEHPTATCMTCSQHLTGDTVVYCKHEEDCETWYCAECHEKGTDDCPLRDEEDFDKEHDECEECHEENDSCYTHPHGCVRLCEGCHAESNQKCPKEKHGPDTDDHCEACWPEEEEEKDEVKSVGVLMGLMALQRAKDMMEAIKKSNGIL